MDAIETEKNLTIAEMFEFLPAIDKIEQLKLVNSELQMHHEYARTECDNLRLANSDLQMYYDYAKTECAKLQAEVLKLRGSLSFISMLTPLDGQSWESHAKFINAYALDQLEEEE